MRTRVELHTARRGVQGLRMRGELGSLAIVVSDKRMPELTGAQILAKTRECCPRPCATDQLWKVVFAGIE